MHSSFFDPFIETDLDFCTATKAEFGDMNSGTRCNQFKSMNEPFHIRIRPLQDRIYKAANSLDRSELASVMIEVLWFLANERPDFRNLPCLIRENKDVLCGLLTKNELAQFGIAFQQFISAINANVQDMDQCDKSSLELNLKSKLTKGIQAQDRTTIADSIMCVVYIYIELVPRATGHLPLTLVEDSVRVGRHTTISFNRTLRVPEDGKRYPLPVGMGKLPIYRVEDYADKVPSKWLQEGGFFIPLYQREALFIEFAGVKWRPSIAKVAVGMINAVNGRLFEESIRPNEQDYVVIPLQSWLDGINKGNGVVGQFVAMPLGQGYTIEEQITDEAEHGGFQLLAYDPRAGQFPDFSPEFTAKREADFRARHGCEVRYQTPMTLDLPTLDKLPPVSGKPQPRLVEPPDPNIFLEDECTTLAKSSTIPSLGASPRNPAAGAFDGGGWALGSGKKRAVEEPEPLEMGIAEGGSIEQQIIVDPYGASIWESNSATPIHIHIVNSAAFEAITGQPPPPTPITAYSYKKRGLPWFSSYDENAHSLPGAKAFQRIMSVLQIDKARGVAADEAKTNLNPSPELVRRIHVPTREQRIAELQTSVHNSFSNGDYEAAIRESTWALDLVPGDSFCLLTRANSYLQIGSYHLAEMDASAAIEGNPRNIDAYLLRAYANLMTGFWPQASNDAKQALALSPSNEYARDLLQRAETYRAA